MPRTSKNTRTIRYLESKAKGYKSDAEGLRYELEVANYFSDLNWNIKRREKKYGYEYDIYGERGDIFTEYLIAECKSSPKVSAKDITRFMNKVDVFDKKCSGILLIKPSIYAYLCHKKGAVVDKDAASVAKTHTPSIEFKSIGKLK